MKTPMNHLLGTIAATIEQDVLPMLEGSDWVASRLRSSLMLLKHLELRVDREGPYLDEVNQLTHNLLAETVTVFAGQTTEHPIFDRIQNYLDRKISDTGYPSLETLRLRYQELMSLFEELIVTLNENEANLDKQLVSQQKSRIRELLILINSKELDMFAIGDGYSPL